MSPHALIQSYSCLLFGCLCCLLSIALIALKCCHFIYCSCFSEPGPLKVDSALLLAMCFN